MIYSEKKILKKGNSMRNFMLMTSMTLMLGTNVMADELDEIKLVDQSSQSSLYHKDPIIGCTDHAEKKEESCSKKPQEIILSKLPTSQQLDEKDLDEEEDMDAIKNQLSNILDELSQLKKEQQADRDTIQELKKLIDVLSSKKHESSEKKMSIVQQGIKKIAPKKVKTYTTTLIRNPIKEISRDETHAIIEVQNNESLSTYAQYYYNDNTQYYKIYKANKEKINKDLQIVIGDHLTIPLP